MTITFPSWVVSAVAIITVAITAGCSAAHDAGSPATGPVPSAPPTRVVGVSPSESATPGSTGAVVSPTAASEALIAPGQTGEDVRELQHRLHQLNWFEGRITGRFDEQTRLAVEGFQAKRGLRRTGEADRATWDSLVSMSREPTHGEKHNVMKPGPALLARGTTGGAVKDLQARLKQAGWFTGVVSGFYGAQTVKAVRGFQDKRQIPITGQVDQRTRDRLRAMTRKPTPAELGHVIASARPRPAGMKLDPRCAHGRVVCVSKAQRTLAWVVDGKVQMRTSVRFGSELTPTREGLFSVGWKSRNHVSKLYKTPMPFALFFSGGQAIHYSADFAARGYSGASHGCVNVRNRKKAAALFGAVAEGDRVVVY